MRKTALAVCVLSAMALGAGALFQPVQAGFGSCTYRCICSVLYKCCTSGGVTSCKPAPDGPLQCPQVAC
jgi:hypothetical protein